MDVADFARLPRGLRGQLTWQWTPPVGQRQVHRAWRVDQGVVYLPRRLSRFMPGWGLAVEDRLPVGSPIEPAAPTVELSGNQRVALAAVLAELATNGTALLDMPPGHGKTILAAAVVATLRLRTLYVVHRKWLAGQAVADLQRYGVSAAIWPERADCTVCTIQTLLLMAGGELADVGVTIVDEVHKYCGDAWRRVFRWHSRYTLGMSGTLCDRPDRPELYYTLELCGGAQRGPIRAIGLPGWAPDELRFALHVTAVMYTGAPEHTVAHIHPATGRLFTPFMDKMFMADPARMTVVVGYVTGLIQRGHTGIYVFCVETGPLSALLAAIGVGHAAEAHGKITAAALPTAMAAKVILTTYGFSSTGVSLPRMTAVVLTTPRKTGTEQVIGRILRRDGDVAITREVIDIVDVATPMVRQYRVRKRAYRAADAIITVVKN